MNKEQFYSEPNLANNINFIHRFIEFIKDNSDYQFKTYKNQATISNESFSLSLKNVPTDPFYPHNTNWFLYFTYHKKTSHGKTINIKTPLPETLTFAPIFNSFEHSQNFFENQSFLLSTKNIANFLTNGDDEFLNIIGSTSFKDKTYTQLLKNHQIVDEIHPKIRFEKQNITIHFNDNYFLEIFRPTDYANFGYASYNFNKVDKTDDNPIICTQTLKSGYLSLLTLETCDFFNKILTERDLLLSQRSKKTDIVQNRFYFREPITLEESHSFIPFDEASSELNDFVKKIFDLQYENEIFSFFNWNMELESNAQIKKASTGVLASNKKIKI